MIDPDPLLTPSGVFAVFESWFKKFRSQIFKGISARAAATERAETDRNAV
jgi:hypothetical protein